MFDREDERTCSRHGAGVDRIQLELGGLMLCGKPIEQGIDALDQIHESQDLLGRGVEGYGSALGDNGVAKFCDAGGSERIEAGIGQERESGLESAEGVHFG
jgi:hypothetical protein